MIFLYLLSTLLFVFGIKKLTSIRTCAQGNRLSEMGMLVAVMATVLILRDSINWYIVVAGIVAGGGIGMVLAKRTPTTKMPELVAALNGFGGAASALVAMADVLINQGDGFSIIGGRGEDRGEMAQCSAGVGPQLAITRAHLTPKCCSWACYAVD